jgi:hypothetical protein
MLDADKNVLSTNFVTQRIFCVKKREFQIGYFGKNCKIKSKVLGKTRDSTLKVLGKTRDSTLKVLGKNSNKYYASNL